MAGGIGSRFWPLSRAEKPKQFLDVLGTGRTFIQQTFDRLTQIIPPENILVVTGIPYRELVHEQLPQVLEQNILCEPMRRNTAPCIAYATYKLLQNNPDAIMVIAPSDHLILNDAEFIATIKNAVSFAQSGNNLVTIGIKPTRPETGYGYIQITEGAGSGEQLGICKVKTFTEKPNAEIAQTFVNSGEFYWNSGMFIWTLAGIRQAMEKHLPAMTKLFAAGADKYNTPQESKFIEEIYAECKPISIDYGVMEKADNVYVICASFGWSDLGSWTSLYLQLPPDDNQNAVGVSNVVLQNVSNTLVHTSARKLTVLHQLDGYLVVDTPDVLLVCKRGDDNEIKQIVNLVKLEKDNAMYN
jgi:mannose-1-phosphate guanylyltransferase